MDATVSVGFDFFAPAVFFSERLKFGYFFCYLIALFELFLFLTSYFFLVREESAALALTTTGNFISLLLVHISLNMVASDCCLSNELMQSKLASFFLAL